MTEKLLQFIWQFQYFNRTTLETTASEPLQILHPGHLNSNQGPDFLNARIRIGNTLLAGSIELHIRTKDWQRHGHEGDKSYQNVILHVVYHHDGEETNIPVLELAPRISTILLDRYNLLMNNSSFIACGNAVRDVREVTLLAWKERLLAERLSRKASHIFELLQETNNHWEAVCWHMLAKSFGGKVNGEGFELIAKSIPLSILAKHKNQIHQLEAILLGQANLLHADFTESYPKMLYQEYCFLKMKYKLQAPSVSVQFLRMRPGSFPTIRLAQLAMLIHLSSQLFSKIKDCQDLNDIVGLFDITANDYWHYHYKLEEMAAYKPKKLGEDAINNIIINTISPLLFAYGLYHDDEAYKEKALLFLSKAKAEVNHITKGFNQLGIANDSAFDSQALIELKNNYCMSKRCLHCSIGVTIMNRSIH